MNSFRRSLSCNQIGNFLNYIYVGGLRNPCCKLPNPVAGLPVVAVPEAGVSKNSCHRLQVIQLHLQRPPVLIVLLVGVTVPSSFTSTCPLELIVTSTASFNGYARLNSKTVYSDNFAVFAQLKCTRPCISSFTTRQCYLKIPLTIDCHIQGVFS